MSKWIRNRKRTDGYPKGLEGKTIEARHRDGEVFTGVVGEHKWLQPMSFNTGDKANGDVMAYRVIEDEPAVAEKTPYQQHCEKYGVAEDVEWEVVESNGFARKGDIATLRRDDGSVCPWFNVSENEHWAIGTDKLRPYKDPSKIAPKLWAAYKDVLNDEALAALRDVICEQWINLNNHPSSTCEKATDSKCVLNSFDWAQTTQGEDFWNDIYLGKYNKPTTAIELQNAEIGIPAPTQEVVFDLIDSVKQSASSFLEAANKTIGQRGDDYDKPEGERSAESVAIAFNAITKRDLTEAEIWLVLQLVKDVRQWQNPERFHYDSALDCVAYAALKAEALAK